MENRSQEYFNKYRVEDAKPTHMNTGTYPEFHINGHEADPDLARICLKESNILTKNEIDVKILRSISYKKIAVGLLSLKPSKAFCIFSFVACFIFIRITVCAVWSLTIILFYTRSITFCRRSG